jgi:thiamine monophosphate synthase
VVYVARVIALKAKMVAAGFAHVPLLVNDRLDVCLAADADGLHVGADDMDAFAARRLLPEGKILGVTAGGDYERLAAAGTYTHYHTHHRHNHKHYYHHYHHHPISPLLPPVEAGANYVACGVLPSTTKDIKPKGIASLHAFKRAANAVGMPLLAIGGKRLRHYCCLLL